MRKLLVKPQNALYRTGRLKRVQSSKSRHRSYLLIDLRIVLHGTAAERIESRIDAKVHLRKNGVMTHHVKLAHLRKSRSLSTEKSCRKF